MPTGLQLLGSVGGTTGTDRSVFDNAATLGVNITADIQTFMDSLTLGNDVTLTGDVTTKSISGSQNLLVTGTLNSEGAVAINDLNVSSDATFGSTVDAGSVVIGGNA